MWVAPGQRLVVPVEPRYDWLYLYGFVQPQTGRTFWLLLPSVNTQVFAIALAEFANDVGAGADRHILLVLDGAGWHTSDRVVCPEGIEFVQLPPYSPELQPAERLWPVSNEVLVNRHFTDLDALETAQVDHCRTLLAQPDRLRGITRFYWWPDVA